MIKVIFFSRTSQVSQGVSLVTNINNYCDIQKMKYFYNNNNTYVNIVNNTAPLQLFLFLSIPTLQ